MIPKIVTRKSKRWARKKRRYISRPYKKTVYDGIPIKSLANVKSGDLLEVVLMIKAEVPLEYVLLVDTKPAGTEPFLLKSGMKRQKGLSGYMELRHIQVGFFIRYLDRGQYELSYKLRAQTLGKFQIMLAQAQAMYAPHIKALSSNSELKIIDDETDLFQ